MDAASDGGHAVGSGARHGRAGWGRHTGNIRVRHGRHAGGDGAQHRAASRGGHSRRGFERHLTAGHTASVHIFGKTVQSASGTGGAIRMG